MAFLSNGLQAESQQALQAVLSHVVVHDAGQSQGEHLHSALSHPLFWAVAEKATHDKAAKARLSSFFLIVKYALGCYSVVSGLLTMATTRRLVGTPALTQI